MLVHSPSWAESDETSPPPPAAVTTAAQPTAEPIELPGLQAAGTAALDRLDVPLIEASSFADALRIEGFLHARDRYGQMDLLRRSAAGELSELVGPLGLSSDLSRRVLGLRAVAESSVEALPDHHRALLRAYVEGVNAGRMSPPNPPQEHRLLGATPTPWTEADSMLVVLGMWLLLNDGARVETSIGSAAEVLPEEVRSYLLSPFSPHDTPVVPDQRPWLPPVIPAAAVIDTRGVPKVSQSDAPSIDSVRERTARPATEGDCLSTLQAARETWPWLDLASPAERDGPQHAQSECRPGSNAWVISGSRTATGAALLANDMHLPITAPAIWYRVSMRVPAPQQRAPIASPTLPPTAPPIASPAASVVGAIAEVESPRSVGRAMQLDGVSLPGVPGLLSGSNGSIAWGFTNADADFMDFVVIERDAADPSRYLVPGGSEPFGTATSSITVRTQRPRNLEVRTTRWGPIIGNDDRGRPLALRWHALEERAVNLALLDLNSASTVTEALDIGAQWKGPQQNLMVAGADGSIGWSLIGPLPKRRGFDGSVPTSWADGSRGWDGTFEGTDRPRLENPAEGIIVTANQRTVPVEHARAISSSWGSPDRAARIRERVETHDTHDENESLAIQLDTRVARLERWRDAIVDVLMESKATSGAGAEHRGTDAEAPPAQRSESTRPSGSAESAGSASTTPRDAHAEPHVEATASPPEPTASASRIEALVEVLQGWNGRADASEQAVALVDGVRRRTIKAILGGIALASVSRTASDAPVTDAKRQAMVDIIVRLPVNDESMLRLLRERPDHLLPPGANSWRALLQQHLLETAGSVSHNGSLLPWGRWNVSDFGHPLLRAVPALGSLFMLPTHEQPGHPSAVRVATPSFSASDRLVVSPGREAKGIIQMPGGQSGHPSSEHFADHHAFWQAGTPLPLVPQPPVRTLRFVPAPVAGGAATP